MDTFACSEQLFCNVHSLRKPNLSHFQTTITTDTITADTTDIRVTTKTAKLQQPRQLNSWQYSRT